MSNNDARIEIRLPSALLAKIDEMRDGRSRSEVIRRALNVYIEMTNPEEAHSSDIANFIIERMMMEGE